MGTQFFDTGNRSGDSGQAKFTSKQETTQ